MKYSKCDKIIFSSSSSVYGANKDKILSENSSTDFPLTPYATSKKTCELLLYNYYNIYNFKTIILRLFSVYGKNQRPDLVFSKFSNKILKNEPIEIYGNGDSLRDYTDISDVINSISLSINYLLTNEKVYEIFNIGNSNPISISKVAYDLYKSYNKIPNIKYIDKHKGDMISTCADITRASKILKYEPKTPYEKGLKSFTEWYLTK